MRWWWKLSSRCIFSYVCVSVFLLFNSYFSLSLSNWTLVHRLFFDYFFWCNVRLLFYMLLKLGFVVILLHLWCLLWVFFSSYVDCTCSSVALTRCFNSKKKNVFIFAIRYIFPSMLQLYCRVDASLGRFLFMHCFCSLFLPLSVRICYSCWRKHLP